MYLLLTDETNLPSDSDAKFFAYGGLFFDVDKLPALDAAIEAIRNRNGYGPSHELKFETHAKPKHVTVDQARAAKEAVLEACIGIGATFVVQVVLNALAKKSQETFIKWGANEVIGAFNVWLKDRNAYGLVAVDRLASATEYRYLCEKFCTGLTFPGKSAMRLDRIKFFGSTCINASHASSAMDIVLGAFRYCINQPRNVPAAKAMMPRLVRLLWHNRVGDNINAVGLMLRPKTVKVPAYQAEYDGLKAWINHLIEDMD